MRISLVSCVLASTLLACAAEDAGSEVNRPSTAEKKDDNAHGTTATGGTTNNTNNTNSAPTKNDTPAAPPAAPNASPAKEPGAPAIVQPPAQAKVPLIAMNMQFNENTGDWIMSRVSNEGAPVYHFTGVQFRIFETPPAGVEVQPLYRCTDANGTHFQTNDAKCEGVGKFESLLGYVYINDPGNGAKPISRCIGQTGVPIVATTRIVDCDPFIDQGITLGFAFDANVLEATP